jgi:DNA mismatch repair protein MutS
MPGFVSSPKPVTSGSSTLVEQHKLPKLLSNFAAQLNQSDLYSWATQAVKGILHFLPCQRLSKSYCSLCLDFAAIRSDVPAGPVDTTLPAFDQQQVTIISSGFSAELDALRAVHADQTTQIAHLQDDFRQRLNCEHARIVNAGIFGLLLELPRSHLVATDAASALELNECVDASTKTARRFSSKSLSLVQQQSHQALAAAFRLELQLWQQLVDQLIAQAAHALAAARALAGIDVSVTLADVAKQRGYVRPQLTTSIELDIRGGQHPMVSASDAARAYFAPNDCVMMPHEGRFWLLTGTHFLFGLLVCIALTCWSAGPNMAGKSTFLRQTALLCIMAQAGSFVPAVSARIGIIDQIMTRAGSSDNLVADQSTFMVEMLETAHILNRATRSSLVIMDEVGRGTATQDGFALAAAVCEHLHDVIGCRTIFATHLHDLHATLKDRVEAGSLVCKAVPAQLAADGSLLFPHKVIFFVMSVH